MTSPEPEAKQRLHLDGLLHEMQRYPAERVKAHGVELKGSITYSSLVTATQLSQQTHTTDFIGKSIEFKNFLWSSSFYDALEFGQAGCYFGATALPTRHGCHEAIPNPG